MLRMFKSSTTHWCVTRRERILNQESTIDKSFLMTSASFPRKHINTIFSDAFNAVDPHRNTTDFAGIFATFPQDFLTEGNAFLDQVPMISS